MFSLLPTTLRILLTSLLWNNPPEDTIGGAGLLFQLRHIHGVSNSSRIIFSNLSSSLSEYSETYSVQTRPIITHRPPSFSAFDAARIRSARFRESSSLTWTETETLGPNVTNRETLLQLAKMTANAYTEPSQSDWYDLGPDWNSTFSYGWEPDADGFRGHVFVSTDESTVVVSIKGTSLPWIHGGPTTKKDKVNDNLLFSCCCARVGPTWSTVCGCYEGGNKCDQNCVEDALVEESLFYPMGTTLYNNISYMYPNSNIWLIGHSLGGSLASLVGITFGVPVVAFEAPGEKMASQRLHLPSPPSIQHVTHVLNTADPIAMGICNGVSSVCYNGGYAMESRCHLGKIIRYDTVGKLGWHANVYNHGVKVVIDHLLSDDWEKPDEITGTKGMEIPDMVDEDEDCSAQECMAWTFGDYRNGSLTSN